MIGLLSSLIPWYAANRGFAKAAELLLEKHVDPNTRDHVYGRRLFGKQLKDTDKLKDLESLLEYLHPNHDGTHVRSMPDDWSPVFSDCHTHIFPKGPESRAWHELG